MNSSARQIDTASSAPKAVWIWDSDRCKILWANAEGLIFWGEESLLDLLEKDFPPSGVIAQEFESLRKIVMASEVGAASRRIAIAPQGDLVRINCRASAFALPDGRKGLRVEARPANDGVAAEADRMRDIIERAPFAISLFAEDGALLMQNAAAERSFGVSELAPLARRYTDRIAARNALRSVLVNGSYSHAADLNTAFGLRRHRITMRRMQDPVTGRLAALMFFTDTSDRTGPEPILGPGEGGALTAPEDRADAIFSQIDSGALVLDDELKPLYLNAAARGLLGLPKGVASDTPTLTALFPRDRSRIESALAPVASGDKQAARFDLPRRLPGGRTLWLRATARRIRWRGGEAWGVALLDVTPERRALIEAKIDQEERTRALNALGVAAAFVNEDGVIESVNAAAERLAGVESAAIIGLNVTDLFDPRTAETLLTYLRGGAGAGGRVLENGVDGRLRGPGGRDGKMVRVAIGAGSRWSGRRRCIAFHEARSAATPARGLARAEAVNRVSHELRTPLNTILGFAEMMLESPERIGDPRFIEYLNDIRESGRFMTRLLEDLLDLRRIESGALPIEFAPVDIANMARRIARDHEGPAAARDIELTLSIEDRAPAVLADAHTLRQALSIIIGHSVRLAPVGGWVRVAVSRAADGAVVFEVIDSGPGLSAADLSRAMEPFGQGALDLGRAGAPGLGLPLARGFVEANAAAFSIQSEPGVGSTVSVIFPADRAAIA